MCLLILEFDTCTVDDERQKRQRANPYKSYSHFTLVVCVVLPQRHLFLKQHVLFS
jgi:hypothetical protein